MSRFLKVSHIFSSPVEYKSGPKDYGTLGISLIFEDGKIFGVDHLVSADAKTSKFRSAEESDKRLGILWDLLRYRGGYDLKILRTRVIEMMLHIGPLMLQGSFRSRGVQI